MRERLDRKGIFTLRESVVFLEQGLLFIKDLEDKNIVQCDIKPENIIIDAEGKVFFWILE